MIDPAVAFLGGLSLGLFVGMVSWMVFRFRQDAKEMAELDRKYQPYATLKWGDQTITAINDVKISSPDRPVSRTAKLDGYDVTVTATNRWFDESDINWSFPGVPGWGDFEEEE